MARSTMAALITRLRRLVGDPAGSAQTWSDDELQDFLDPYRQDTRNLILRQEPTLGSPILYLDYYADANAGSYSLMGADTQSAAWGDWEDDAVLADSRYSTLTPDTSEPIAGHWAFTTQPQYPVFLTGKSYDLHSAAADCLEAWAALLKREYDFRSNLQSFSRSQQVKMMLELAAAFRGRGRAGWATQVRGDINPYSDAYRNPYDAILRR